MIDISLGKAANLAFMFDDKFLTSKNAIIRDCTISLDAHPIEVYSAAEQGGAFIPSPTSCEIRLDIITPYFDLQEILTQNRIRDKRVEDCTIQELIIAINNKI